MHRLKNAALQFSFVALLTAVFGCSDRENLSPMPSIIDTGKSSLSSSVNCKAARHNIATLGEERASVGKQIISGVRSILPFAAVAGILMGDYRNRVEVASGQYNADIEAKIQVRSKLPAEFKTLMPRSQSS